MYNSSDCPHSMKNTHLFFKALKGSDKPLREPYVRRKSPLIDPHIKTSINKCQDIYEMLLKSFLVETTAFAPDIPACEACWSSIVTILAAFHSAPNNTLRAMGMRIPNNLLSMLQPLFSYFVGMFTKSGCEPGAECIAPCLPGISRYFYELGAPLRQYPFIHPTNLANISKPLIGMHSLISSKVLYCPPRPKLAWLLFGACVMKKVLSSDYLATCSPTELHNLITNIDSMFRIDLSDIALLYNMGESQVFLDAGDSIIHSQNV